MHSLGVSLSQQCFAKRGGWASVCGRGHGRGHGRNDLKYYFCVGAGGGLISCIFPAMALQRSKEAEGSLKVGLQKRQLAKPVRLVLLQRTVPSALRYLLVYFFSFKIFAWFLSSSTPKRTVARR